jgi:hypothetical protein
VADPSRMEKMIGFKCRTSLDRILGMVIEYQKQAIQLG